MTESADSLAGFSRAWTSQHPDAMGIPAPRSRSRSDQVMVLSLYILYPIRMTGIPIRPAQLYHSIVIMPSPASIENVSIISGNSSDNRPGRPHIQHMRSNPSGRGQHPPPGVSTPLISAFRYPQPNPMSSPRQSAYPRAIRDARVPDSFRDLRIRRRMGHQTHLMILRIRESKPRSPDGPPIRAPSASEWGR